MQNDTETSAKNGANLVQRRSGPVRWELIDKDGNSAGTFTRLGDATFTARRLWPDQEQDEDRTGKGWDIQVVGMT